MHEVVRLPLLDSLPIEFDATREGPRAISWRADAAATLKWVEAQDGGDPKRNPDVRPRDVVFTLDLTQPLSGQEPVQLYSTDLRRAPVTGPAAPDPSAPELRHALLGLYRRARTTLAVCSF